MADMISLRVFGSSLPKCGFVAQSAFRAINRSSGMDSGFLKVLIGNWKYSLMSIP
ncbi:hypothetical protein M422DRAFT_28412 [Sphaerobolus stellatus SS14]|nr:hypothetical protein M422DRAFT_28412 [Sphaerobolus stellatus SS14]